MAQAKTHYVCQSCGSSQPRWLGRCPSCGEWNTFIEEAIPVKKRSGTSRITSIYTSEPLSLAEVKLDDFIRTITGIPELDRVLGGGFVPASSVLFGGDPGVGKSTLLLQVASEFAVRGLGVLYVTAEESPAQLRLRSERLQLKSNDLQVLGESDVSIALSWAEKLKPRLVIVDSIQTCRRSDFDSVPGTVSQVREVTSQWTDWAKHNGGLVALVGHVTKEGAIAGPRVVEHIVDVVLLFEGDQIGGVRILRALKNRFGATGELGVFEMSSRGLQGIADPSSLFLSDQSRRVSGVAVGAVMRGSRPLLIELQALVTRSFFASPQRNATGVDPRRLAMWIAVLEKRVGLALSGQDIFLNATGGLRLDDSAADLAASASIYSSLLNKPLTPATVMIGEVGLTGELRSVPSLDRRLAEVEHLGFKRAIIPAAGWKQMEQHSLEIIPVHSLEEAIAEALENPL